MSRKIFYLGTYYSDDIDERNPSGSRAENYKIDYVVSSLIRCGFSVDLISAIGYGNDGFYRTVKRRKSDNETHIYLGNYSSHKKILCSLGVISRLIVLFFYLLKNIGRNDTLIVYHTPLFYVPIKFAQVFKRFQIVDEIEEIFFAEKCNKRAQKRKKSEIKLLKSASKYILANDILKDRICSSKKNGIVVYGPYFVPERKGGKFNDGRVHIVYGGGCDYLRRVDHAVEAMKYLNDTYCLHIFTFGDSKMIDKINRLAVAVNSESNKAKVIIHKPLSGDSYTEFLQKCDIGLNLQIKGSGFEELAFPSKISTYLGCGLNVISSKLTSIEKSSLYDKINFYDENSPKSIADSILKCKINSYEYNTSIMNKLDEQFVKLLQELLNGEVL